jgi:formylglycine-generating enzyme required for sulfatase activity
MRGVIALGIVLGATTAVAAAPSTMARVGPGVLHPVYAPEPGVTDVMVPAFELDRLPVTNGQFLQFVKTRPQWQRDQVPRLFADEGYLAHWATPTSLGGRVTPDQPVTRVSWFAASAYCEARGERLPAEDEWELAAAAGAGGPDGRAEPGFREKILAAYARVADPSTRRVGEGQPNFWGVSDLHGLVWEWVLDFNRAMVTGDARDDASIHTARFCGAGALQAADREDYAGFMRVAFRSSLEARYTTSGLGFRCARDVDGASR